jgi:hypothetical protein
VTQRVTSNARPVFRAGIVVLGIVVLKAALCESENFLGNEVSEMTRRITFVE